MTQTTLTLTPRQTTILKLAREGFANKQIAHELGISEQTIKVQMYDIFERLGVHDRTSAVVTAIRRGLISLHKED